MSVLIILDNPEDKLTIKKLIAEVFQEQLKEALSNENSSRSEDRLLIEQASEFLGISKSTIYKATCKRLLPHFKKGRRLYFSRKELQQWIAEGKRNLL